MEKYFHKTAIPKWICYTWRIMVLSAAAVTGVHLFFHYPFTLFMVSLGILINAVGIRRCNDFLVRFWARCLFWSIGKQMVVSGRENLGRDRIRVIIVNHASLLDIPAILTVLPDCAFIGRSKLLKIPVFGKLLRILHYIPIDPEQLRKSMASLQAGIARLQGGKSIVMFPEGTRTLDGRLGEFKRGFIRILRSTGADLQPITLNGFFALKPKYRRWLNPKVPLGLHIHPLITAEEIAAMDDADLLRAAHAAIASSYLPFEGEECV